MLGDACWHQPLSEPVPADDAAFAARKGPLRLALRAARKAVALHASGQSKALQQQLSRTWRRLLWVHEGMPQIGDALMDLAPRSLLVDAGFAVDLFAAPHIAALFEFDAWFGRALSRPEDVQAGDYDAVVVLSHDRKALQLKRTRLGALPWVSLQGFYGGPDFHRARFATRRLADLLGLAPSREAFARHSRQKLARRAQPGPLITNAIEPSPAGSSLPDAAALAGCVALAIGGVWPERTWHHWPELIDALGARGLHRFVLVGSDNGREMADRIAAAWAHDEFGDLHDGRGLRDSRDRLGRPELHDLAGRASLHETRRVIDSAAVVVCTDGGLMHLAFTTRTPVVALFGAAINPAWRVPLDLHGAALRSPSRRVNDIGVDLVARSVLEALASDAHAEPPAAR